ncbi:hypothetical protein FMUND_13940 [Fusarium mundagurra]|uniref:Uncharacterized protein n=1 Tax=Fusarium mundagurra TaxID=1567541 RepID=A0A8H5XY00_9HYPO|nr:hypothetical protein FMUND_13940 [Fusarium mundagurra]
MNREDLDGLRICLFWSIVNISCSPHSSSCEQPSFEITHDIIEEGLALLDPEDFMCQALRYYQFYLEHKELRKHDTGLQHEIVQRLHDRTNMILTENNLLRYTAGNWLEELLETGGEQAIEAASTDYHGSENKLTTEAETATGMDVDLPEAATCQTSLVELPNEARSEPQDPTQIARKRRLDDDLDTDESSRIGKKRARFSQEPHERGAKRGFSAIS